MRSIGDDQDYVDGEITTDNGKDDDECTNRNVNDPDRNDSIENTKYQLNLDELSSNEKIGKNIQNSDINDMDPHEPDNENDREEIESKFGEFFGFVFELKLF